MALAVVVAIPVVDGKCPATATATTTSTITTFCGYRGIMAAAGIKLDRGDAHDCLYGNPERVPMPSRDGARRAKLAGSPRD